MRLLVALILTAFIGLTGDAEAGRQGTGSNPTIGDGASTFEIFVSDTDIDDAWELIVQDDSTWTQITTNSTLVVNPAGNDSAAVTISGLLADSTYTVITSTFGEGSSTSGNRDISGFTWYAIENWFIQDEHSADISLAPSGSNVTPVSHIDAGDLWQGPAQVFFGSKNQGYLEEVQFGLLGTGTVTFEVRVYPDFKDIRDIGDGYYIIAKAYVVSGESPVTIDLHNKYIGSNAVVQVWALGAAANASGWAKLVGRRNR
jgi:hypothetical protein